MSAITRNRELSQLGSFIYIDDATQTIAITEGFSPNVGIGSTIPTSKLDVLGNVNISGDTNISGVVTATSFSGTFIGTATNATTADYALVAGLSTVSSGILSTSSVRTSGIITASAFYINDTLLINPELATWLPGVGSTVYRLGNVGIGTSVGITERLTVSGNVSAQRLISTVASGTAPFSVASNTVVTNLNADLLRGKLAPSGDIVGTTDTQTLTNKTLTTPSVGSGGANFNGSTGSTNLRASTTASGTLTLPAETGTLVSTGSVGAVTSTMIANNTITNEDISTSAAIAVSKLASSTISGITLGNDLNALSFGSYLVTDGAYNGSTARTVSIAATTANTGNALVVRDPSGDFNAGTINASYLNATFTVTAADFNSTSDLDLKTNVNTVENALETVNSLRGVSFDWKSNGKKSYGVIAQELEAILPDLVATQQNKSVNYNGLVGVLIQAVKELSVEVEELKKKVS
jgi:hypothetical protein